MLLALDIGNSQTSYGIFKNGKLLHHWRSESKQTRTADEYAAFLFPLLEHAGLKGMSWDGIAICSVVPPVEKVFESFCQTYLKMKPFKVKHDAKLPFTLQVDVPHEVGADRIANSAYAVKHLKLPALVVDLGTATTIDVITEKKTYEGGAILPGIQMSFNSLSTKTSLLPLVDVDFPKSPIGKNTATCIQSGILFGYIDAIDGLLSRTVKEVGKNCEIVLTGGLAPMLAKHLRTEHRVLPDLTLEGIEILFQLNR